MTDEEERKGNEAIKWAETRLTPFEVAKRILVTNPIQAKSDKIVQCNHREICESAINCPHAVKHEKKEYCEFECHQVKESGNRCQ